MNLQLLLVVLTVWKNFGLLVGTDACSLLPGGLPKCFPNAVDYTITKGYRMEFTSRMKEIKYRLQNKNQILGYDFNGGKHILRLGQRWDREIGGKSDFVTCQADFTEGAYMDTYLTKLFDYTKDDGSNDPKDVIGEKPVTSYFVVTKKEVWKCSSPPKSDGTKIEFIRVVTELLSRDPPGSILFFDGVDVTAVQRPPDQLYSYIRYFNSIVREVKYLDPANPSHNLKYNGYLKFVLSQDIEDRLSSFKPIEDQMVDRLSHEGYFQEKPTRHDSQEGETKNECRGHNFYEKLKKINRKETLGAKYKCSQKTDDPRLYSAYNLPVYTEYLHELRKDIKLGPFDFNKNFIITNQEVWSCMLPATNDDGSTNNPTVQKFDRIVTEFIGKTPIRTLYYYYGENRAWKFVLDERFNTQSMAFKTIFYSSEEHPKNRLNFDGELKLERAQGEEWKRNKPFQETAIRLNSQKSGVQEKENDDKEYYQLPYDNDDVTKILKTFGLMP